MYPGLLAQAFFPPFSVSLPASLGLTNADSVGEKAQAPQLLWPQATLERLSPPLRSRRFGAQACVLRPPSRGLGGHLGLRFPVGPNQDPEPSLLPSTVPPGALFQPVGPKPLFRGRRLWGSPKEKRSGTLVGPPARREPPRLRSSAASGVSGPARVWRPGSTASRARSADCAPGSRPGSAPATLPPAAPPEEPPSRRGARPRQPRSLAPERCAATVSRRTP